MSNALIEKTWKTIKVLMYVLFGLEQTYVLVFWVCTLPRGQGEVHVTLAVANEHRSTAGTAGTAEASEATVAAAPRVHCWLPLCITRPLVARWSTTSAPVQFTSVQFSNQLLLRIGSDTVPLAIVSSASVMCNWWLEQRDRSPSSTGACLA